MSWKPPKEFGGTSPAGLAELRALGQLDLPYAKSLTPGAQAYKAGGFDRVERTPPGAPAGVSLYVSDGRRASSTVGHIALSTAVGVPHTDLAATVFAGDIGGLTYVGRNTVMVSGFESDNLSHTYRTTDFKTKIPELTIDPPISAFTGSAVTGDTDLAVSSTAGSYNLKSADIYQSLLGGVMPYITRRDAAGTWMDSGGSAYASYDHSNTTGVWQLTPDRSVGCWGVFARQTYYAFATGTRPNSPTGAPTPFPLLEVSTDAGRTFSGFPMDPLFSGCTTQWAAWDSFGASPSVGDSIGGFEPATTFMAVVLRTTMLFGFRVVADAGLQYRMFKVADVNATADYPAAAVPVTTPPGFLTTWNFMAGAFSDRVSGAIVFVTTRNSLTVPARLLITMDLGASWIDRPLPWPGLYTGEVRPLTAQSICAAVYNPSKLGVELMVSKDLGVTWRAAGMVATNTRPPSLLEGFQDFFRFQQINLTPEGLEPTPDPMAPYRYNFRFPP